MINFGQLEARVRILFEAESEVRWSTDNLLESVNDGLDELSEATYFYERSVPIPLRGGQIYYDLREYVPRDVIRVNSVFSVAEQIWLDPITVVDLRSRWETYGGSPIKYMIRGAFWLGIHPRPNDDIGSLRVFYSCNAPHFSNPQSVLSDIPTDSMGALEDYALYDLNAKDGDDAKALRHWGDYIIREGKLGESVKNRVEARVGRLAGGPGRTR